MKWSLLPWHNRGCLVGTCRYCNVSFCKVPWTSSFAYPSRPAVEECSLRNSADPRFRWVSIAVEFEEWNSITIASSKWGVCNYYMTSCQCATASYVHGAVLCMDPSFPWRQRCSGTLQNPTRLTLHPFDRACIRTKFSLVKLYNN